MWTSFLILCSAGEYTAAFSSRPKIPRTPDGSQSLHSDRLPTPTQSSGVPTQSRPSSAASDKLSKAATNDGKTITIISLLLLPTNI